MSQIKKIQHIFLSLILVTFFSISLSDAKLEKMTIAYSAINAESSPVWIPKERGFYEKYGLDVQLIYIAGGAQTAQAMVAKDILISQVGGTAVVNSSLSGYPMVMIAVLTNTTPYSLVTSKDVKKVEDLKGKKIGIGRFGGSPDLASRYLLEKFGLIPDKDVAIVQLGSGGQPLRFAALQAGRIHGILVSPPLTLTARKMGLNVIIDLGTLGLEFAQNGVATSIDIINTRQDTIRKFMKAYVEGIHYLKTDKQETIKIISKYTKNNDLEMIEESYNEFLFKYIQSKPYPTLKGIQIIINEIAKRNPKAKDVKPEQFVDMRFVKELDESGFFDRLYSNR